MIPIAYPLLGAEEKDAVLQVLESGQLAQGKHVVRFERDFARLCQVEDAIAVSSGTAALYLALLAHDIGPGDEVITTAFSFAATANVILMVGATPIFVDIEPDTYNINPYLVARAITKRTKALLPVHLYGNPCSITHLVQIAEEHRLALIEDACQAHAATVHGKPVGGFGTGCFSFYATKNMTTGEGGMVTTNHPALAARIRLLRNHGQATHYHQIALGYNLRMTDIQAAIGVVQLQRLEKMTAQRIANATLLTEQLQDAVQTPSAHPEDRHVYHQYTIRVAGDRDAWVKSLQEQGIDSRIHYPVPIHQQPFYREHPDKYRCVGSQDTASVEQTAGDAHLPVTEEAARHVLSLPVHPALSTEDVMTIAKEVLKLCR
jgi:perosamine synthetase